MKLPSDHVGHFPPQHPRLVRLAFANRSGALYAGPYRAHNEMPRATFKVKLASELRAVCDFDVPCVDFGVPHERRFRQALQLAALNLIRGRRVFAGCGYGIGRTGTFIAAVFKLHRDVLWRIRESDAVDEVARRDPVEEAREAYYCGAVETKEQRDFIHALDLTWLARWIAFRVKPQSIFDKRFWDR